MRTLCCPLRSPLNASNRLPGGTRRSCSDRARCRYKSFLRATRSILRNRGTSSSWKSALASLDRNERITGRKPITLRVIAQAVRFRTSWTAESGSTTGTGGRRGAAPAELKGHKGLFSEVPSPSRAHRDRIAPSTPPPPHTAKILWNFGGLWPWRMSDLRFAPTCRAWTLSRQSGRGARLARPLRPVRADHPPRASRRSWRGVPLWVLRPAGRRVESEPGGGGGLGGRRAGAGP